MSFCTDKILSQLVTVNTAILEAINNQSDKLNDQTLLGEASCFDTGEAKPVFLIPLITVVDGKIDSVAYLLPDGVTPYVGIKPIPADPCDCMCLACDDVVITPEAKGCGMLDFGDYFNTEEFKVEADAMGESSWKVQFSAESNGGASSGTAVADYLNPVAANKSEWYATFVTMINSMPNWSITLVTDTSADSGNKVKYKVEYAGTTGDTLRWKYGKPDGTIDYYEMTVAADGTVTYVANDDSGAPFGTPAWNNC